MLAVEVFELVRVTTRVFGAFSCYEEHTRIFAGPKQMTKYDYMGHGQMPGQKLAHNPNLCYVPSKWKLFTKNVFIQLVATDGRVMGIRTRISSASPVHKISARYDALRAKMCRFIAKLGLHESFSLRFLPVVVAL